MRRVRVTDENSKHFTWCDTHTQAMIEAIDEMLHDKGLELVLGDDGSSDHALAIVPTQEDGEYDHENTKRVMFPKRKSIFELQPVMPGDDAIFVGP